MGRCTRMHTEKATAQGLEMQGVRPGTRPLWKLDGKEFVGGRLWPLIVAVHVTFLSILSNSL